MERSIEPLSDEIQVFKFLNHLYHSARDYERMSTENMIHTALQAVEAHSQTLAQIEAETRPNLEKTAINLEKTPDLDNSSNVQQSDASSQPNTTE